MLKSYGVRRKLMAMMTSIVENAQAAMRVDKDLREWFKMTVGTRQGDPTSATTFR